MIISTVHWTDTVVRTIYRTDTEIVLFGSLRTKNKVRTTVLPVDVIYSAGTNSNNRSS